MASNCLPSLIGPTTSQVLPWSLLISKWTIHTRSPPFSISVLDGEMIVPSFNCTGLFLTGPSRCPIFSSSPSFLGSDQRSEEHTSELQSLMRISYAVFCLKKKKKNNQTTSIVY